MLLTYQYCNVKFITLDEVYDHITLRYLYDSVLRGLILSVLWREDMTVDLYDVTSYQGFANNAEEPLVGEFRKGLQILDSLRKRFSTISE